MSKPTLVLFSGIGADDPVIPAGKVQADVVVPGDVIRAFEAI